MAKLSAHRMGGFILSGVAAIAVGFITMTSFMLVFPGAGLGWGVAVFFAGCLVEGDVYLPGVTGSLKSLFFKWGFLKGIFSSLKHALVKQEIRDRFGIKPTDAKATQAERKQEQAEIEALRENDEVLNALIELAGLQKQELTKLQKLKYTQFVEALLDLFAKSSSEVIREKLGDNCPAIVTQLLYLQTKLNGSEFQAKFRNRKVLVVTALIAALGTGIAFGAITFTHVAAQIPAFAALMGLSATPVGVFAFAGVLAAFASVAYFMMMYHTLVRAIEGNVIQKIKVGLKNAFMPKHELKSIQDKFIFGLNCFFKLVTLAAIIGLAVVVTMAISDAWFASSAEFFSLIATGAMDTIPLYASAISYALVWGLFFPITTLFTIESSGNSVQDFWEKIKAVPKRFAHFFENLRLRWQAETFLQFINPFRFLASVLESILATSILGAHIGVSGALPGEGAGGDGFMNIPALPATILGSASEGLVDADFIIGGDHDEHDHHHHKKELNNLNKGVDGGHDHDHNHGLTPWLVHKMALPFNLLAYVWDNLARRSKSDWDYHAYKSRKAGDGYELVPEGGPFDPRVSDYEGSKMSYANSVMDTPKSSSSEESNPAPPFPLVATR